MSGRARVLIVLAAVCLLLAQDLGRASRGGAQAQQGQQQQAQQTPSQQPTFRAGVSAVRVDVVVTDRQGMPVGDLTAADFQIIEDGKPQAIDSFKLIRVQTRQEPGGEAPRAIRTFEDEETELARDDVRIIVILLDDYHVSRASGMNLRSWLHRFIDTQVGPYDVVALMYPMTPTSAMTFTRDKFALTSVIDRFEGRLGDYMPRNQIEANYAGDQPWRIEEIRSAVVGSAIKSACYHLGSLNDGRKSLIVVAEGLVLHGNDLYEIIEAANRSNVAIYALDPHGVGGFGASDVLRSLAEETNGRAITNRNDLDAGLSVVVRDSSAYYLLGYNSDKRADGKFHEIKVRVTRPGLEVRARKGYWAPTPIEAARAAEPPKPAAPAAVTNALGGLAQSHRAIGTWLGVSRGDGGRTRVTFVCEPALPGPGEGRVEAAGRVLLVASGANGAKYFDGPVGEAAAGVAAGAAGAPRAAQPGRRAVFQAPPGTLQLKVTVEAVSASPRPDVIETETRDVVVPDLSGGRVALSTPAVFSARTPRELRELSSDPAAMPTVARQFARADRLLIRFDVYGPATAIAARLLNRNGDAMTALPVQPAETGASQYSIELPISTLARGDYVIEISAKGGSGEAKEMVAIRVTG